MGLSIKVNKYENNNLLNLNNGYSKVLILSKSYHQMQLKVGDWFKYHSQGSIWQQKITSISFQKHNAFEIVLSQFQHNQVVIPISYVVGKQSLWSMIFS